MARFSFATGSVVGCWESRHSYRTRELVSGSISVAARKSERSQGNDLCLSPVSETRLQVASVLVVTYRPPVITVDVDGAVATFTLNRPEKRNAISLRMVATLAAAIGELPDAVKVIVLAGSGDHFSAGLDLSELEEMSAAEGVHHSHAWYEVFQKLQFGKRPVVAVLHGAVVGGGLELASSTHIRVAEKSTFYGLPEGTRGIFVGGGGSVRISRLIGVARMADMMLTGRVFDAEEGQQAGLTNYLVGEGEGLAKGMALAQKICGNAPLSNFAVIQALPRIAELAPSEGLFVESLVAAIAQGDPAAKERILAFLDGRAAKVAKQ